MNVSEKKKALLAYKEKLLQDIKYCETSIDEFHRIRRNNNYVDSSSESEDDLLPSIDTGPSVSELKIQQSMLTTCLQATQELTNVTVLQSEVNIVTEELTFEGEPPVKEPGTWREVTADCRVDLVPFSISFYVHTPHRKFAAQSYCGLRVVLVKAPHEAELSKSVLHSLKRPSDAVEVLRSYADAYRSRRSTLARLASKYGTSLFMEVHPEGGFLLKCANLLEVIWRLENKWSSVAPFVHRMKFDLEYMEEDYIKIISHSHKQLSDPAIQTDERTLLLSKIISTCLEAKGPVDPQDSMESDLDSRPDTKKDSEVMAPPKSLPKKAKTKNVPQKRSNTNENDNNSKRIKTSDVNNEGKSDGIVKVNKDAKKSSTNKNDNALSKDGGSKVTKIVEDTGKNKDLSKENRSSVANKIVQDKPKNAPSKNAINPVESKKSNVNAKDSNTKTKIKKSVTQNPEVISNTDENVSKMPETSVNNKKSDDTATKSVTKPTIVDKNKAKSAAGTKTSKPNSVPNKNPEKLTNNNGEATLKKAKSGNNENIESVTKTVPNTDKITKQPKSKPNTNSNKNDPKLLVDKAVNKISNIKQKSAKNKESEIDNNVVSAGRDLSKENNDKRGTFTIDRNKGIPTAVESNKNDKVNIVINDKTITKVTEKNIASLRDKDKIASKEKVVKNKELITKPDRVIPKNAVKSQNVLKTGNIKAVKLGNKIFNVGSTEKENAKNLSKIPQKKLSLISESSLKKNPLRISPRKIASQFKLSDANFNKQKMVKSSTNIPRLMKKPVPKPR